MVILWKPAVLSTASTAFSLSVHGASAQGLEGTLDCLQKQTNKEKGNCSEKQVTGGMKNGVIKLQAVGNLG